MESLVQAQDGPVGANLSHLREQFAVRPEVRAFLVSSNCSDIIGNMTKRESRWEAVCDAVERAGAVGMVLSDEKQEKWCLITPDPKPGAFRYSYLDHRGFIGHGECKSPEAALVEAFAMGFQYLSSPGKVDEVIMSSGRAY